MAPMGNLMSYLRAKSETESVTPDTTFRFNSKDISTNATDRATFKMEWPT
jgi:hypothetical protein